MATTRLTRHIRAPRSRVYRALLDADAVQRWQVPDIMTSQVHAFDAREGGEFRVSLTYDAPTGTGKTTAHTDTYHGRFTRLVPDTEVVQVVFDPRRTSYDDLLKVFWENHDPTQGMRQGNDVGTQYRSAIYTHGPEQQRAAEASREAYGRALAGAGHEAITTEIAPAPPFYYAEEYHQQYLAKNPDGYCGIGGTGVACPVGLKPAAAGTAKVLSVRGESQL